MSLALALTLYHNREHGQAKILKKRHSTNTSWWTAEKQMLWESDILIKYQILFLNLTI